jgi:hypothetical protein
MVIANGEGETMTDTLPGTPAGQPPSAASGNGGVGTTAPTISDAATAGVVESAPAGPTAGPPSVSAAASAATATWQTNVTVDATWATNEVRNAWMRVVNIGWKKIFNGSDASFIALTTLAAQARQTGHPINYREEADGMVHEIYLW